MHRGKKTVAIIMGRGGSKRVPLKNIRPFCGKPIIAYPIGAAQESELFDKIIVSTDSEEIARVAKEYGAEVPFLRPAELADDHTSTAPVLAHALNWLVAQGTMVDVVCCIYATAAFVRPEFLRQGYDLLKKHGVSSVFPVTTFASSIYRALQIGGDGRLKMVWPEHELTRSNDLPEAYHDTGQFYWLDSEKFLREQRIYSSDAMPIILPRAYVQDIDTPEDWQAAELKFKALMHGRG